MLGHQQQKQAYNVLRNSDISVCLRHSGLMCLTALLTDVLCARLRILSLRGKSKAGINDCGTIG
jgi:hypothetical protein